MSSLKAEAILIDEELKAGFDGRSDEEKVVIRAVHLIFEKYDINKDGMISVNELELYIKDWEEKDVNEQELREQFEAIDTDNSEFISKIEMIEFLNNGPLVKQEQLQSSAKEESNDIEDSGESTIQVLPLNTQIIT